MTMPTKDLASLYAEVVRGTPKDESRFVGDPGFSETWDTVVDEVEDAKATGKVTMFEIPNEWPDIDEL